MFNSKINRDSLKLSLSLLLTLMLFGGCGRSSNVGLVSGTVTMNGQPAPKISIEFFPVSGGRPSIAVTDEAGKYAAFYTATEPGCQIGKHTLQFEKTKDSPDAVGLKAPAGAPAGAVAKLKPTEIEVKPGDNTVDLEIVFEKP